MTKPNTHLMLELYTQCSGMQTTEAMELMQQLSNISENENCNNVENTMREVAKHFDAEHMWMGAFMCSYITDAYFDHIEKCVAIPNFDAASILPGICRAIGISLDAMEKTTTEMKAISEEIGSPSPCEFAKMLVKTIDHRSAFVGAMMYAYATDVIMEMK